MGRGQRRPLLSLCWRKLTDVISSAIVSLPSEGKCRQTPSGVKRNLPPPSGLAGEVKVDRALQGPLGSLSAAVSGRPAGLGSGSLSSSPCRCDSAPCYLP